MCLRGIHHPVPQPRQRIPVHALPAVESSVYEETSKSPCPTAAGEHYNCHNIPEVSCKTNTYSIKKSRVVGYMYKILHCHKSCCTVFIVNVSPVHCYYKVLAGQNQMDGDDSTPNSVSLQATKYTALLYASKQVLFLHSLTMDEIWNVNL